MENKTPLGIIHGRFQPPHNGHVRYALSALKKCDHLLIGICTPTLCTREEAIRTGYPCTQEQNPFSYEERVDMIRLALQEQGIDSTRYSCIPFPSDYANIGAIVAKDIVFYMSVSGPSDRKKIDHLTAQGYTSEIVLMATENRERSDTIRENARTGGSTWKTSLSPAILKYLQDTGLDNKLGMLQ